MSESNTFTARAGLVALGMRFQQLHIWEVVTNHVHIHQKVRRHTPLEKLLDCFINILAGGHGLVEINTRVRPDQAVQAAFGRTCCAEQSTISETLNACTPDNVQQLRVAVETILRQYGHSYRHDYQVQWQLLDVDMTGLPAGRLGEGVTKGYFAQHPNARGRQLGRVVATDYDEVIIDLAQLVHNLIIWTRDDLAQVDQRLEKFGVLRTVRNVFQIPGCVHIGATGRVTHVTLNACHPLAASAQRVSSTWFKADDLSVNLGKI